MLRRLVLRVLRSLQELLLELSNFQFKVALNQAL
jgi:hypothetical protein